MRDEGLSLRAISKTLGIGKSTVSSIVKASGPALVVSELDKAADEFISEVVPVVAPVEAPPSRSDAALIAKFTQGLGKREEVTEPADEPIPDTKVSVVEKAVPDKGALIAKITVLVTNFGPLLKDHVKNKDEFLASLNRKSVTDLTTTLGVLDAQKTIANGANALRHMFVAACSGVEMAAARFMKLKSEGFAHAVASHDEELRMIFLEIACERVESMKRVQRPELRLALLITQTLLAVDAKNRSPQVPQAPADEKYKDL